MRICWRRCCIRYGHLCTPRCEEHLNWNLKDAMDIYGKGEDYAGIILDDGAKEPENNGSSSDDFYVRFAKAVREERKDNKHVKEAQYVDAKEKKSEACRQYSRKGHWCATGGR